MNSRAGPVRVGWKVSTLSTRIASVRYRALLPMLALEGAGVRSRVFADARFAGLDELDALVVVKSFSADDLRLVQEARALGVQVIVDLCDNIFVGDYGGRRKGVSPAQMFVSLAEHADCVVVTTDPLAEVVRAHLRGVPVVVIPDGIESPDLAARMATLLREAAVCERQGKAARVWRERMRNALHRMRDEGVSAVPALIGSTVRKVGGAVARPWRRGLHDVPAPPSARALAASAPRGLPGAQRIAWFGNHGAEHARFGMLDLLEWREALETVASERAVELVVVSNDRDKYEAHIRPLAIPSRYVEWSSAAVHEWLEGADAVVIPNTLDPFSACKSANRTVLALAHGVPVVATMTAALRPLEGFIASGDPLEGLRSVLAEPAAARSRALDGYRHAEALFGTQSLKSQWLRVLETRRETPVAPTQPALAVLLHLIQDLDLALPILRKARATGLACEAWCTTALLKKSPRVLVKLKDEGIPFRMLPDEEELKGFQFPLQTRALLTVAESSLGPHRIPRLLTDIATRQGRFVATLQHGFENVGLTYEDELHTLEKVDIAAHRIYTWGPPQTLHPRVHPGVRARCVPVGCPKEERVPAAQLGELLPAGRPVVGIFENLHWHRYSDAYRESFVGNVQRLARDFPQAFFLVKPHHAGVWLSHRYEGQLPAAGNLLVADPQSAEWEHHTAGALLPHLAAVITTPSTVALDAARQGLPVAVVGAGMNLDNYSPLTVLSADGDWPDFLAAALDPSRAAALREVSRRFVDRVLTPGDAAGRIVEDIRATAGLVGADAS